MDPNRVAQHPLDSPVQDQYSPESIRIANLRRITSWVRSQPPERAALYCDHGSYVGYKRALAYRCPLCPEK